MYSVQNYVHVYACVYLFIYLNFKAKNLFFCCIDISLVVTVFQNIMFYIYSHFFRTSWTFFLNFPNILWLGNVPRFEFLPVLVTGFYTRRDRALVCNIIHWVITVSYTHLDVYKRQHFNTCIYNPYVIQIRYNLSLIHI